MYKDSAIYRYLKSKPTSSDAEHLCNVENNLKVLESGYRLFERLEGCPQNFGVPNAIEECDLNRSGSCTLCWENALKIKADDVPVENPNLSANKYQSLALRTARLAELGNDNTIINVALGLSGESGEFADSVKKWKYQGHKFDNVHAKNEIGDILWYCAVGAAALGYTLEEVMHDNIEKLKRRYPKGFDAEKSVNRSE